MGVIQTCRREEQYRAHVQREACNSASNKADTQNSKRLPAGGAQALLQVAAAHSRSQVGPVCVQVHAAQQACAELSTREALLGLYHWVGTYCCHAHVLQKVQVVCDA